MRNKRVLFGLLALVTTGLLAAFYWLEFFPSKYKFKLGLMLALWLVQSIGLGFLAWQFAKQAGGATKVLTIAGGIVLVLVSLLYCFLSCDMGGDRGLRETPDLTAQGLQIEAYQLDRHDHVAVEVFAGKAGSSMAKVRFFSDHFSIRDIQVSDKAIVFQNDYKAEDLVLDVETFTFGVRER
jgi:hypothetical protein